MERSSHHSITARTRDVVSGSADLRQIKLQLEYAATRALKLAAPNSLATLKRPLDQTKGQRQQVNDSRKKTPA